jgi:hypothetical protein
LIRVVLAVHWKFFVRDRFRHFPASYKMIEEKVWEFHLTKACELKLR